MKAWVGLGANLGDPRSTLLEALALLAALPGTQVSAVSSFYGTAPVDAQGPDFVNAVARLDTVLEPLPLLQALQGIERQHGRLRPYRHAPRTLDLDLLLYEDRVVNLPGLSVPHPRLHLRAFVLVPLLELDPAARHPLLGPLPAWLARAADQAIRRLP